MTWTIERAYQCRSLDKIVVSSDDDEILDLAESFDRGLALRRPHELAQDDTPGAATAVHASALFPQFDWIVLLQPTSPLRTPEDTDACLHYCLSRQSRSCVSLCDAVPGDKWLCHLDPDDRIRPAGGSDTDASQLFRLNGAIYAARTAFLQTHRSFLTDTTLGYRMPRSRSLDLDTVADFAEAEGLLSAYSVG